MSGFRVEGLSGLDAEVDANHALAVNLPTDMSKAGYEVNVIEVDAGSITGTALRRAPYVTQSRRLAVGLDTCIFDYTFNAAAQDTGVWKCAFSTMTMTQGSGSLLLNANSSLVSAAGCSLSTWRYFQLLGGAPLRFSTTLLITAAPLANEILEFGQFVPTTTTVPTDGVYFSLTSAGLVGVINYNGTPTPSGVLIASPTAGQTYQFVIIEGESSVEFWVDPGTGLALAGSVAIPAANGDPFITAALPFTIQMRNSALVSGSPVMQVKVSDVNVQQKSLQLAIPFSHQMAMQKGNFQGLSGGTQGSLALYGNSLAAGAGAAMTNTTAALGTGLGGQYATQPTLAVGTDGIVCSYLNPVGSINQTPRTFVCTGVKVHSVVTTALTGGPVVYAYSLAFGHNAVSMATAESASFATGTTKAPRRIALGFESFAATAAVGAIGSPGGINMEFNAPVVVNPGEYIAICAKNLGTVTSAGVIVFHVTVDGYWI